MAERGRRVLIELVLVTALLCAGLRLSWGIGTALDVGLYDESIYLFNGVALLSGQERDTEARGLDAPLYALWYALLAPLAPDRVALYLLNYQLLIVLPPLLVYAATRVLGAAPLAALAAGSVFLIAAANGPVWPKIGHFALGVALAVVALVGGRSALTVALGGMLGAAALSYARPEFALAALLGAGGVALALWQRHREAGAGGRLATAGLVALASAALLVAGPAVGGGRSYAAFSQHFALRWVAWNSSELNPWTNSAAIASEAFGNATSIGGALLANPALVLRHITANLLDLPVRLAALTLPAWLPEPAVAAASIILAVALGLLLVWRLPVLRANLRRQAWPLALLACLAAPALLSVVVIYPRDHYLVLPLGLLLVALAMLCFGRPEPVAATPLPAALGAAALALLLAWPQFPPVAVRPNIATLAAIEALQIRSPVQMLEDVGGFYIYLGPNFRRVPEYEKQLPFDAYRAERGINMVVVTPRLLNDPRYRDDPGWQAFLADPAAAGFVRIPVSGTDRELLVHRDLLP